MRDLGIFYPELGDKLGLRYVDGAAMGRGGIGLGVRVLFAGADANLGPPGTDGMLGIDVLSMFDLIIDYPNGRLFLRGTADSTDRAPGPGGTIGATQMWEEQ